MVWSDAKTSITKLVASFINSFKIMIRNKIRVVAATTFIIAATLSAQAGNENRSGSSSANQLLINPWARSSGLMGANMAAIEGVESSFLNVAGLAFIEKTEVSYGFTNYMVGSDIGINTVGLGQRIGDASVLSLSIMTINYGDIEITSGDLPEGGVGNFSPRGSNFALSYARSFSNSIYGGITVRVINENISNVKASGVAFDAGLKYVTGKDEQFQFGITLKNFGPPMSFDGDGLFVEAEVVETEDQLILVQTSEAYEIPALLSIAGSYDFNLAEDHVLTAHAAFVSNSFSRDQFNLGAEYVFADRLILRGGYRIERSNQEDVVSGSAFTGLAGGLSVNFPFKSTDIRLDYSYRDTNPFNGTHSIGIALSLK